MATYVGDRELDRTPGATLDQVAVMLGRMEKLIADHHRQSRETQAALRAAREQEEGHFRHAMAALFQEHRQRTEASLRPAIIRAWQAVVAVACVLVLLFAGGMLLLRQTHDRLKAAQARADAVEVEAEVREASRHVELTSCGGRPCIRIDKGMPTWKHKGGEYVLVDGK